MVAGGEVALHVATWSKNDMPIVTINVRSPRRPQEAESLNQHLHDLEVEVGVVTDSRPCLDETESLQLPGHTIVSKVSRPDSVYGEAFTAVRVWVSPV